MKKLIHITISLILFFLMLTGCHNNTENLSLISKGNNYIVYEYQYNEITCDYMFVVFDDNGNRIDSAVVENHEPTFNYLDATLLAYELSFGTNAIEYKFYDIEKSIVSETYQNIYYQKDNQIAFIEYENDKTYICYKELFEKDNILKEELDMDGIMSTEFEIVVNDDFISVTHSKGESYDEITENFSLNKTGD